MRLDALGWSGFYAGHFAAQAGEDHVPERVIAEHKGQYRVQTEAGEMAAILPGKVLHAATRRDELPVVGDWVILQILPEEPPKALVHGILPRRSWLSRKEAGTKPGEQPVAANIDTLFLAVGLDDNYRLRRIERYLAVAWQSGADPVVLLTKADLCSQLEERLAEARAVAGIAPIHAVSALTGEGLDALAQYLVPRRTLALLGSSGVGKSTLINHLLGEEVQSTQPVRAGDSKGRHTTTSRQIFLLPSGALVVDTPGIRELQIGDAWEGVAEAFPEIEELAFGCRYADCQHEREPGCRVRAALSDGTLDPARFENYRRMRRELAYQESTRDRKAERERKQQAKKLCKMIARLPKKGESGR